MADLRAKLGRDQAESTVSSTATRDALEGVRRKLERHPLVVERMHSDLERQKASAPPKPKSALERMRAAIRRVAARERDTGRGR